VHNTTGPPSRLTAGYAAEAEACVCVVL
jgi:hypothetical protein